MVYTCFFFLEKGEVLKTMGNILFNFDLQDFNNLGNLPRRFNDLIKTGEESCLYQIVNAFEKYFEKKCFQL